MKPKLTFEILDENSSKEFNEYKKNTLEYITKYPGVITHTIENLIDSSLDEDEKITLKRQLMDWFIEHNESRRVFAELRRLNNNLGAPGRINLTNSQCERIFDRIVEKYENKKNKIEQKESQFSIEELNKGTSLIVTSMLEDELYGSSFLWNDSLREKITIFKKNIQGDLKDSLFNIYTQKYRNQPVLTALEQKIFCEEDYTLAFSIANPNLETLKICLDKWDDEKSAIKIIYDHWEKGGYRFDWVINNLINHKNSLLNEWIEENPKQSQDRLKLKCIKELNQYYIEKYPNQLFYTTDRDSIFSLLKDFIDQKNPRFKKLEKIEKETIGMSFFYTYYVGMCAGEDAGYKFGKDTEVHTKESPYTNAFYEEVLKDEYKHLDLNLNPFIENAKNNKNLK